MRPLNEIMMRVQWGVHCLYKNIDLLCEGSQVYPSIISAGLVEEYGSARQIPSLLRNKPSR